jgi:hypothetical protein
MNCSANTVGSLRNVICLGFTGMRTPLNLDSSSELEEIDLVEQDRSKVVFTQTRDTR